MIRLPIIFAALLGAWLVGCRPAGRPPAIPADGTSTTSTEGTSTTSTSTATVAADRSQTASPFEPGAKLYEQHCATCHGSRGEGDASGRANALANQDFLATASNAFLSAAVERGRPGTTMKAYGGEDAVLTREQRRTLVDFIRAWQTIPTVEVAPTPIRGDPQLGAQLYASRCADCHGTLGQGATALSLNNPVFLETASDGFLRYAIVTGRRNTPMGPYGDRLSAQQIDDLVALIRSWGPEDELPHES